MTSKGKEHEPLFLGQGTHSEARSMVVFTDL
jgi:hypothetical protein